MVVTHKGVAAKKRKPMHVKADNPARKFMSHDEAVADNARLKADREAIEKFAEDLRNKGKTTMVHEKPKEDNAAEVARLEAEIAEEKGPGSRARKAALQAKIDALEGA